MIAAIESSGGSLNRMIAAAAGSRIRRANGTTATSQSQGIPKIDAEGQGQGQDSSSGAIGKSELTKDERREVEKLSQRDAEVRRHEQAHKATAGGNARGGPTFEYQTGPDGKRYAVGGEVSIDLSPVKGDPQATISKMQQVRQAANAPAEPSGKDRQVAAKASQLEQQARQELTQQRNPSTTGEGTSTPTNAALSPLSPSSPPSSSSSTVSATTASTSTAEATSLSPGSPTMRVIQNNAAQSNAIQSYVAQLGAKFTSPSSTTAGQFIDVSV